MENIIKIKLVRLWTSLISCKFLDFLKNGRRPVAVAGFLGQKALTINAFLVLRLHGGDLEVAVEHENDQHDWMDEVVKLVHIVCPLRVVIGYLPWEKRNNIIDFDLLNLNHVTKELKKLACYDNMSRGEFLVILGNCNTSEDTSRFFGYKGYIYNVQTQNFMPLNE